MPVEIGGAVNFQYQYLEVPLALQYTIKGNKVSPYFFGGVNAGRALQLKWQPVINMLMEIPLSEKKIDLDNDLYNAFNIDAMGGAGVEVELPFGLWYVEGKYLYGLSDLLDEPVIDVDISHRNILLNTGINFRF